MSKRRRRNQYRGPFIPSPKVFSMTRYTYDAWMKCYPESNRAEWIRRTQPFSLWNFITSNLNMIEEAETGFTFDNLEEVKIITIDDDYFTYISEKGLKNNSETRSLYNLDPETAEEKLQKYGFDKDLHLCAIPVHMVKKPQPVISVLRDNGKIPGKLPGSIVKKTKQFLEKIYGEDSVWVSGNLMRADTLVYEQDGFFSTAEKVLYGQEKVSEQLVEDSRVNPEINIFLRWIPVVVKGTCDSAKITLSDVYEKNGEVNVNNFPELVTEEYCVSILGKDAKEQGDEIESAIKRYVESEYEAELARFIIRLEEVPEYAIQFTEILRNDARKAKIRFATLPD